MRKLLWILLFSSFPFFSGANQVSGYISLKCLYGTTYQVTIVDFTTLTPTIDTVRVHWGDVTSGLINLSSRDTLCDSLVMNTYIGIHTFPGNGTYRIWIEDSNRVPNIINMSNSSLQDFSLFHSLTLGPYTGDSIVSPVIANQPICSYGCTGQCYTFNLGAYSPAGDSLSYALGSCMALGYYIPANASIDPITGTLTWCNPPSNGLYNFSIRITTYRSFILSNHTYHVAVDTEEVELEANIQPNCSLGMDELSSSTSGAIVYPNPNNGKFTIQVSEIRGQKSVVEVYNMLGEKIFVSPFGGGKPADLAGKGEVFQIDLSSQPAGIYLYRIITQTGNLVSEGKFIIQK